MECLATFDTTHDALSFEKSCRSKNLNVRIVPVPRALSASCGLACNYPCWDEETVRAVALENEIEVAGYHRMD